MKKLLLIALVITSLSLPVSGYAVAPTMEWTYVKETNSYKPLKVEYTNISRDSVESILVKYAEISKWKYLGGQAFDTWAFTSWNCKSEKMSASFTTNFDFHKTGYGDLTIDFK